MKQKKERTRFETFVRTFFITFLALTPFMLYGWLYTGDSRGGRSKPALLPVASSAAAPRKSAPTEYDLLLMLCGENGALYGAAVVRLDPDDSLLAALVVPTEYIERLRSERGRGAGLPLTDARAAYLMDALEMTFDDYVSAAPDAQRALLRELGGFPIIIESSLEGFAPRGSFWVNENTLPLLVEAAEQLLPEDKYALYETLVYEALCAYAERAPELSLGVSAQTEGRLQSAADAIKNTKPLRIITRVLRGEYIEGVFEVWDNKEELSYFNPTAEQGR